MRVFEILTRSGAKVEVTAEIILDNPASDPKIYFYRDKGLNQLVAYFQREEVAGIIFGPDTGTAVPRYK